uniref:PPM-type phosphatase domain-containing protein n=1 Tax=Syphacia muris TaxID=451379 RepID=A0A0N5AGN5_9BILA
MLSQGSTLMVISDKPGNWDQYPYSCWGMKNIRRKMEDRSSVFPTLAAILPNKKDVVAEDGLFAVFDGHNGSECASYASVHFPTCFVEVEDFKHKKMEEIMTEAFAKLTKRLDVRIENEFQINYKSGSTALCAHISNHKKLCIGWCGDSTAAMMYSTSVELLNKSHVPDDPEEAKRVEDSGGFLLVVNGELRVDGILNITRSLGDISAGSAISSIPSVLTRDLDGTEYLLILGSDGLYDAFDGDSIFSYVKKFVQKNSPKEYRELSRKASDEGSHDNITAICVFLRPVEDLWTLFSSTK